MMVSEANWSKIFCILANDYALAKFEEQYSNEVID